MSTARALSLELASGKLGVLRGPRPASRVPRPASRVPRPALWLQPMHHPRKRDDFADVLEAADPGDGALETEAKAGVDEGAVAAEVEIPVVGIERKPFFLDAPNELVVVVLALRAADD